jgi:hypothetical protein
MIKLICIFAMLITTHEDIKKQSCHLHCQSAHSVQSGKPLYLTGVFKMNNQEIEIWKDIDGFSGDYQISSITNVRSLKKGNVKILKKVLSNGYYHVGLCKNGIVTISYIHRLVAIAFIPNPNNLPCVNHINNIRTDNRIENLEWVTHRENISHGYTFKKTTSKYTGVSFVPKYLNWRVCIIAGGEKYYLGAYPTEQEANNVYKKALKEFNEIGKITPYSNPKNSSKYRYVYFFNPTKKWGVRMTYKGKRYFFGYYKTEEDAYCVAKNKRQELMLS